MASSQQLAIHDDSNDDSQDDSTLHACISEEALSALNEMRRGNLMCDAVLNVTDGSFNVHRVILSSCSPYFRALFTNSLSLETQNVFIPDIHAAIMEELINYAYLRKCEINASNVHELLSLADYVGMTGLVKQCKIVLGQMLTPKSCFGIMRFAKRFRFCEDLYKKARTYLLRHFTQVAAKNEDILKIGVDDFLDIITDNMLNTRDEELVWKLCIKWIDYDLDERQKYLPQLMQGVRLGLMNPKFFMDEVKDHPYVVKCLEARPLILETLSFLYELDTMKPNDKELVTPSIAIPRLPHEVMFAIGGWNAGTSKSSIETYDTRADRWVNILAEDPAGPRGYHGAAVIGYKIYVIGGYNGVECFNTCRVFDAIKKTWKEIAPMHSRRCYVSVAVLNGHIYAMGGYDGINRLNTVERYNPKTNQWSMVTSMNMQRSDANACTLDGKIYATGGFNGQECLATAEYYDPTTETWTSIPSMNHRRSGVSSVAYRNHVYVIGGFNGLARLSTGEKYNPETETWSFIREMIHARSNFGLEIIDDMIFAVGGFNGIATITHTECYVAETDEWMEATNLNIVRSALTASAVSGLPNIRDYIHQNRELLMEDRRQRMFPNIGAIAIADNYESADEEMTLDAFD